MQSKKPRKEVIQKKRVYLDYASGTPIRKEISKLVPDLLEIYANPSSIHKEGYALRLRIEDLRLRVSNLLGAMSQEIYFTSGSTEGANIALRGVVEAAKKTLKRPHVVTSAIEHPAVLETLRALEKEGADVSYLVPDKNGIVQTSDLRKALRTETVLIAISLVNSEIGAVAPVKEYAKELRRFRKQKTGESYPLLFVDATQAPLCLPITIKELPADMLVLDAGKMGGLKGSGILYVNRLVEITPVLFGGGQEKGLRPGTQNILGIETCVRAFELAQAEVLATNQKLEKLSQHLIKAMREFAPSMHVNGSEDSRASHIVSLCFKDIDAEWIVLSLDARGISVSRGSACKSGKGNESEVLRLIDPDCKESSVRFSFGIESTNEDVRVAVSALKEILVQ